ncbi:hypothetical protein B0H12DRAFT_1155929 [Mycena haematopus]|nr:hypothetical protein B0H12DRAFT_1155929 [Mycena haematopus]
MLRLASCCGAQIQDYDFRTNRELEVSLRVKNSRLWQKRSPPPVDFIIFRRLVNDIGAPGCGAFTKNSIKKME